MQLSAIRKSLVFLMALGVSGCFLDQIDDESTGGGDPTDPVVIAEDDVHAGLSEMAVDLVTGVLAQVLLDGSGVDR